ncbi:MULTISPECIES: hypothetical protein [unclassified Pseudomonas]|uniref:hypothetical protein n=1 Tax=unclassified Pseudomonas TaxID=196821 RepID=UPI002005B4E7|nr:MULTISPECIES: hypothetical protein [unclassified Pseudomonas]MCK6189916.1 hypothetical protein [Pseudomonas sp. EYE_354]WLH66842.1 hypothetical protein PSH59_17125 [Pseudomonas sp. FP2309]
MPLNTRDLILSALKALEISDLAARPFDCAFELLAAPPSTKRLIMIGFNGSLADALHTNAEAVRTGYEQPAFSNVAHGVEGGWGSRTLARRLTRLPTELGFDWRSTIYTNALLLCSSDAASIGNVARQSSVNHLEALTHKSMDFFEQVTMRLSEPELIIAYSNGLGAPSAAKILWENFGHGDPLDHVDRSSYRATYGFTATIGDRKVPVVGIRHLSRFQPSMDAITQAWERQKARQ